MLFFKEFFLAIIILIIGVFCVLTSIYGCFKIYCVRYSIYIIKRSKHVVILSLICYILFEMISFIGGVLLILYREEMLHVVSSSFHVSLSILFMGLIPSNWIKYYTYNWSLSIKNTEWKSIINGEISNNVDNWFIKHKNTYGNSKYITKYIVLILIVICLISTTFDNIGVNGLFNEKLNMAVIGILFSSLFISIPATILSVIIIKMQKYKDNYYMVGEQKLHVKMFSVQICTIIFVAVYTSIAIHLHLNSVTITIDICISFAFAMGIVGFLLVISSTFYVIHYNENIIKRNNHDSISDMTLDNVMHNQLLFEPFMEHMVAELTVEALTSYVEFNQFLIYLENIYPSERDSHPFRIR